MLPLEKIVIDALKNSIEANALNSLSAQLNEKYFIQRMYSGRINSIIFYEKNESHKILNARFDDALFKVRLGVDGKKENAHIVFFDGYISSIEFKNSKKHYRGKEIKVISVTHGRSDKSHAAAIDRLEHGSKAKSMGSDSIDF